VSPDRLDAMVWCVSELMLKPPKRYVERAGPPIAIYQR
jgi:phage terminase large subunit-like protein